MVPYLSIVGYSNSGKTTLICRLIEIFTKRGLRIGTLKHDAHHFEIDHEGKDTWKHRQAGASVVMISSASRVATIETVAKPVAFEQLLGRFTDVDFVLVEGYKKELARKIVVARTKEQWNLVNELEGGVVAVATTLPAGKEDGNFPLNPNICRFDLNQPEAIAEFILETIIEA